MRKIEVKQLSYSPFMTDFSRFDIPRGRGCVLNDSDRGVFLFQDNCLAVMDDIAKKHPAGCFDMIFADPPYFLSNGGMTCKNGRLASVNKGDWDRSKGVAANHAFNVAWLGLCQQVLKPNGTLWVSGTMHIVFSIGFAMQQLGFKLLNDIVWEKPNPPPNLSGRYFTHATETLLWAAKSSKAKHCFNDLEMRADNHGNPMRSVWRIAPPLAAEKIYGKHPTQKPIALIERCIASSTKSGDFILDPFAGSGSTGVAALNLKRRFCGIELEHDFMDIAMARLRPQA